MKKTVKKMYRVECNYGSKYFTSFDKALAFFEYKASISPDVELWRVSYNYCARKKIISASQELLGYTDGTLAKF